MAKRGLEYVASLDRGLRVLAAFSREQPQLTLSAVASITGLSPATARRSLHTLELLGYVGRNDREFLLRPQVLRLSAAYLAAISADVVLQPFIQQLVNEAGGAAYVSILDGDEVIVLASASNSRAFRLIFTAGTRLPAYATDMGRVLLAALPGDALDRYLAGSSFRALTEFTETNPERLHAIIGHTKRSGAAATQDELEYGLVSVAVPVRGPDRQVVAAVSCADVANHVSLELLVSGRLPMLQIAARGIEHALERYPELAHSVNARTPRAASRARTVSARPARGRSHPLPRAAAADSPRLDTGDRGDDQLIRDDSHVTGQHGWRADKRPH